MDCQETKKVIPDYVEHTVSEEVTNAVEEHLCVCPSCRDFLSQCIDKAASKDFSAPEANPKPQQAKAEVAAPKPDVVAPKPAVTTPNAEPIAQAKIEPAVTAKPADTVSPAPTQVKPPVSAEGKFGPFEIGIILIGSGVLLFLVSLLLKK